MRQLWQWIKSQTTGWAIVGAVSVLSVSGCRHAERHSCCEYPPSASAVPADSVPDQSLVPYDDNVPPGGQPLIVPAPPAGATLSPPPAGSTLFLRDAPPAEQKSDTKAPEKADEINFAPPSDPSQPVFADEPQNTPASAPPSRQELSPPDRVAIPESRETPEVDEVPVPVPGGSASSFVPVLPDLADDADPIASPDLPSVVPNGQPVEPGKLLTPPPAQKLESPAPTPADPFGLMDLPLEGPLNLRGRHVTPDQDTAAVESLHLPEVVPGPVLSKPRRLIEIADNQGTHIAPLPFATVRSNPRPLEVRSGHSRLPSPSPIGQIQR